MRVSLLGPLAVEDDDGAPVPVPGPKVGALLAILALDAGRVVPTDRLIEDLWADAPPARVANSLQQLMSKLRKALGSADLVVRRPPGYLLAIDPRDVDVHRLPVLAASARAALAGGDREGALAELAVAEALWRGPALADFAYDDFARPHVVRLDELRISLVEERVELELDMGRDARLVTELETLVAGHPLREHLRAQLMLALYRAGRQADALRAYQDGRKVLADELGLEPGPELQALESAVLNQDPALLVTAAVAPAPVRLPRTNVKVPLTPLVGRTRELRDLAAVVAGSRLTTIVGPGGAGKTRLAIEAARRTEQDEDGVFVVELAPIGQPDQVPDAVAAALDLPESAETPTQRIVEYCTGRRLLLVLDNAEHLVDAVASLAGELLSACEGLRVLATSREALGIDGETVWPIPPMTETDAADLFVRRAAAVDPAFATDDLTAASIDEICTRLDGLPLAIELAAARTRAFSIGQIAERLDDRFRLLTGGSRTAMERQQTLRAVVQWSYDLLFEDERRLFDRLSIFAGGCTLETAEAICGSDPLERDDIADLLTALVQKSLLIVDRTSRRPRFRLLQTLRQFGRERLVERGEADVLLNELTAHFTAVCASGRDAFQGRDQRDWHDTMDADRDNVRTAFDWAVSAGDKETALKFAADLGLHRWVTGGAREGHRWLEAGFALPGSTTPFTRGWALLWHAFLGYLTGHSTDADAHFEESIELLREHGGPVFEAYAMSLFAQIMGESGRREEATKITAAALDAVRAAGDDPWVRANRTWLEAGLAIQRDGDVATFEALLQEALPQFRDAGDEFMTAICLDLVAELDDAIGDIDAGIAKRREALEIVVGLRMARFEVALLARLGASAVLVGDHAGADGLLLTALLRADELSAMPVRALALNAIADLHRRTGLLDEAEYAALEARALYQDAGPRFSSSFSRATAPSDVPLGIAASASVLGHIAAARGDAAGALAWHRDSYRAARTAGRPGAIAVALEGLAAAAALDDQAMRAAQLIGAADLTREVQGIRRARSERADVNRVRAAVTHALGADYAAAYESGRRSPIDDLVADE